MKLFFDTETTGLPLFKRSFKHPAQPHIIQLSAILTDNLCKNVDDINHFIKPDGWVVTDEIEELTGISQEQLEDEGIDIRDALHDFMRLVNESSVLIGHNLSFDKTMVRIELARIWHDHQSRWFDERPWFCTMHASTALCNIPPTDKMLAFGMNRPKPPKLAEAYRHFYGQDPEVSHNALADVETTIDVYRAITQNWKENNFGK